MSQSYDGKVDMHNVIFACMASVIMTIIIQGVVMSSNHRQEVAELRKTVADEMAYRSIEPVVWVISNYPGSDVTKSLCEKGWRGQRVPTRLGTALVQCKDPEGRSAIIRGRNLDDVPTARATFPFGRSGPLAELETNPNSPNFANWHLFKNGED